MGEVHEIEIDVEALTESLKVKMSGNLTMPPSCSIFRIPTILSRHCPRAFLPNQFSFGPFHHLNETLKLTEKIKSKYLLDLITRVSRSSADPTATPDTVLLALMKAIAHSRDEARQYYAGPIEPLTMAEFAEVLVLDGCFIVELFRRKAYATLVMKDDPIFNVSCLLPFLSHDLLLLENQLPWMVLEKLFDLTVTAVDQKPLFQLTVEFFSNIFSKFVLPPVKSDLRIEPHPHGSKHILDLLRNALILSSNVQKHKSLSWEGPMRSATTLFESGIRIRPLESASVLDIEFDERRGILYIPAIFIQETTQTVLRNLIGLEQCCPNYDGVITSYAVLLDNLINSRADMEILCKNKIIDNWLNVNEATKFFDKLFIDAYVKETFYRHLTEKVNGYCKKPWHSYRRVLMRDYFKHPWALISVIAAAVILALTVLQTVLAILKP